MLMSFSKGFHKVRLLMMDDGCSCGKQLDARTALVNRAAPAAAPALKTPIQFAQKLMKIAPLA
jgi:hypothetical protein